MHRYFPIFFACIGLFGCVSASYVPPTSNSVPEKRFVVNLKYDEAYSQLVTVLASSFFAIDNFEKESGLITLSYQASGDISKYIDCGHWDYRDDNIGYSFQGKYETYLVQQFRASLAGRLNIVMKPKGEQTELIINSRYVFGSFVFDGLNEARISTASSATDNPIRICRPTGFVEKSIADAIQSL